MTLYAVKPEKGGQPKEIVIERQMNLGGGVGSLYLLENNRDFVFKKFHENENARRRDSREKKAVVLCKIGQSDEVRHVFDSRIGVAWPSAYVESDSKIVGYLMPFIHGRTLSSIVTDVSVGLKERSRIAYELARLVCTIHNLGMLVGDLHPSNFMVEEGTGRVVAIDTDSFSIYDREGKYGEPNCAYPTLETREPSLQMIQANTSNLSLDDIYLLPDSDDSLLATTIFRLLYFDHPLESGASDIPDEIRVNTAKRHLAYFSRPDHLPLDNYGTALASLLTKSFTASNRKDLPTAYDYFEQLKIVLESFSKCAKCGEDLSSLAPCCYNCKMEHKEEDDLADSIFVYSAIFGAGPLLLINVLLLVVHHFTAFGWMWSLIRYTALLLIVALTVMSISGVISIRKESGKRA